MQEFDIFGSNDSRTGDQYIAAHGLPVNPLPQQQLMDGLSQDLVSAFDQ